MNFFFDGEGNLINNANMVLRQGSNRANVINFIAPISPSAVVYIGYKLPNGYVSYRYPMVLTTATGLNGLQDGNGNTLYVWQFSAKDSLTAYSGDVMITFYVVTEDEDDLTGDDTTSTMATFSSVFTVEKGVGATLPEEQPDDVWQAFEALYLSLAARVNDIEVSGAVIEIYEEEEPL